MRPLHRTIGRLICGEQPVAAQGGGRLLWSQALSSKTRSPWLGTGWGNRLMGTLSEEVPRFERAARGKFQWFRRKAILESHGSNGWEASGSGSTGVKRSSFAHTSSSSISIPCGITTIRYTHTHTAYSTCLRAFLTPSKRPAHHNRRWPLANSAGARNRLALFCS